jgi:flagellar biosynthesis GTPase FlhF
MKEALLQIKQDLGENAMILNTRKLPRKLFGLATTDEVEVTAAIDDMAVGTAATPPLKMSGTGVYGRRGAPAKSTAHAASQPESPLSKPSPGRTTPHQVSSSGDRLSLVVISEDIRELKDLLKSILPTGENAPAGGVGGAWAVLYKRLTGAEVSGPIAEELITTLRSGRDVPDDDINKRFIEVLSDRFPVAGPIGVSTGGARPRIVAFVGPTGAGKTTTWCLSIPPEEVSATGSTCTIWSCFWTCSSPTRRTWC